MRLQTVCGFLLAATIALGGYEGAAVADDPPQPPLRYNAFDLGTGRMPLFTLGPGEQFTSGRVLVQGSTLSCGVGIFGPDATSDVAAFPDNGKICPLFTAREPGNLTVQIWRSSSKTTPMVEAAIEFDKGSNFAGSVAFDGKNLAIKTQPQTSARAASAPVGKPARKQDVCFAYYQPTTSGWQTKNSQLDVSETTEVDGVVEIPLVEPAGNVYLMLAKCPVKGKPTPAVPVLRLSYAHAAQTDDDQRPIKTACSEKDSDLGVAPYLQKDNHANYTICIDQANAAGLARILQNKDHYIATHSFGRLVIRHWKTAVPVVSLTGSAVGLPVPGLAGAAAAASSTSALVDGQGLAGDTTGDRLISTVFIPPHAPGTLHLDVKFVDPSDSTKAKATNTSVDLIVDQGYSGALRLGLGHVWNAPDRTYPVLQRMRDSPKEIVAQSADPTEVVVGYSLYLNGFSVEGRTYNLLTRGEGWPSVAYHWCARHVGVFAGFGALSYSSGNVDFLRSIYFGPELEISPNISLAVTGVYRRSAVLSGGLQSGDPVPESGISTSSKYDVGVGFVLTFAPEFAKFATTGSGGSK